MSEKPTIEFFFDIGSPYSYLAATQIDAVGERAGAEVTWRPFLLGGVFKATGNTMPAGVAAKHRYMVGDLLRWAKRYGEPINFPSRFPLNTIKPQRALVAVARSEPAKVAPFALALFRAYWVDDQDVSQPEVLAEVATKCGLDGPAVASATDDPEVKDLLRSWTEEAVERGAFGAPAMFVGGELYWGNDRLEILEQNLRENG